MRIKKDILNKKCNKIKKLDFFTEKQIDPKSLIFFEYPKDYPNQEEYIIDYFNRINDQV